MMPVTGALIVLNIAAYLLGGSGDAGFNRWGFWPGYLTDGDHSGFYRMFTSMFVHGSLIHISFNMYFLYVLGPSIEKRLGTIRYLLLYGAAGLWGAVGIVVFQHQTLAAGASGALFGLMGALAVLVHHSAARDFSRVGTMIVINLGLGFVIANVGWGAHVGGLVGGALLMEVYLRLEQRRASLTAAYGAALAVAVAAVAITYTIAQTITWT